MSLLLSLFRGARLSTSQAWRSSTLAPLRPFHAATTLLDASSPEEKQQTIVRILTEKFQPSDLQVQDVSGTYSCRLNVARRLWLLFCHYDQGQSFLWKIHHPVPPLGE